MTETGTPESANPGGAPCGWRWAGPASRRARVVLLLAGILFGQCVLYGPSLIGRKILLPLELLALPGQYLPDSPDSGPEPDTDILDLVHEGEPNRRFVAAELRAGRWPGWSPYRFSGAPFVWFDTYNPLNVFYYLVPSPFLLAWMQVVQALIAGGGAFCVFRRVLGAGYWPSVIGAWCFPLTGFLVLWQGYPLSDAAAWFPWVLLATHRAIRDPSGLGGPCLALVVLVVLLSRVDMAGHMALASVVFGSWCGFEDYGRRRSWRQLWPALGGVGAAWLLAVLLSAPHTLPLAEYALSSNRVAHRTAGATEERGPWGWPALAELVLPDMYGTKHADSAYLSTGNREERTPAGYIGLFATLFLCPLGWCSRRHRSVVIGFSLLAVLSLAGPLDLPVISAFLHLPGVRLLPHNRFVFVAAWSFLAIAVVGLDHWWSGLAQRPRWWLVPAALAMAAGAVCVVVGLNAAALVRTAAASGRLGDPAQAAVVESTYQHYWMVSAGLCGLTAAAWAAGMRRGGRLPPRWLGPIAAVIMVAELLWFAHDERPQSDPALYYPPLPPLEALAAAPAGRVLGVNCLPPNLGESYGLRDIRGYDGFDPSWYVELLELVRFKTGPSAPYALTQWYVPRFNFSPTGEASLPAILNMLNVRYLIFREPPPPGFAPFMRWKDYWVVENPDVMPRVVVPRRVETMGGTAEMLAALASMQFDPRRVAYTYESSSLPAEIDGSARILEETASRIEVGLDMRTAGLVVLADRWDAGWRASVDGIPAPIQRTNHAIRGVIVPARAQRLVFVYEPKSLEWGLWLMAAGGCGLLGWGVWAWSGPRRPGAAGARSRATA